jgi:DNA-binding MarR family transcriptional regulator
MKRTNTIFYESIQLTRPLLRQITSQVKRNSALYEISVMERAILDVLLTLAAQTSPMITKKLQIKRQFTARILNNLRAKDLILTSLNPNHQKSPFYSLTRKGLKIISKIKKNEMEKLADFCKNFTQDEIAKHYKVQHALNEWFQQKNK